MDTLAKLRSGELNGIRRLDLACGLTEFPREILDLADTLEILNLTGNRLSELPDDLPRLRKLRILFCSDNVFTHLPAVLGACPALEMIGFKANHIESIHPDTFPERLRWLILTDNRLETLPASIGSRTRLQKLMLAGNRLENLPDEMAACENLELLRLSANRFISFPEWLFRLPRLAWLALGGNPWETKSDLPPMAEVDWNEIEKGELLGEGASGLIHKARWKDTDVALKIFKGGMTS
ncbi:MAG: protein kinase, partial [Verrucomicrobiaceae bacterium]